MLGSHKNGTTLQVTMKSLMQSIHQHQAISPVAIAVTEECQYQQLALLVPTVLKQQNTDLSTCVPLEATATRLA